MYRGLILVFLGLCVGGAAVAAEAELSTTDMDEVVVTATRQEEEISKVPANVTVITAEEIDQSAAQNVPELLRSVAGVLVNDIAGNGRNYTVDLRGFGETASLNTLVLVDGRRINQPDLGGVDWSLIPKERVERIEIVRGGRGSVLYGDNATGGVINIITQKSASVPTATGGISAGSYDSFQGNATVAGVVEDLSIVVNGNYRTSDGYRDNSDTRAKDVGLNLGYDVSDRLSLSLSGGYHEDNSSLPGALKQSALDGGLSRTATIHPDDYADIKDKYLQGGFQFFVTDNSYLDLKASIRKRESKSFSFYDDNLGRYLYQTDIETVAFSPQLVLNEQFLGCDTNLVLGFDYEESKDDVVNDSIFMGYPSVVSHELIKKTNGYFAHGAFSLAENLTFSGGLRGDRVKYSFKSKASGYSDSNIIDEELYTLGANYRLMGNSSLYASYSRSFRYPVLDEMFSTYGNKVNVGLGAQKSDDFEVGMRLQFESGLELGVNLFHVVTEDEIYLVVSTYENENLDGDSIRQGIELSASQEIYDILFSGSYTFRDTNIDGGQYDGSELPNVPKHQWTLGAQKKICSHLQLALNGTYVGERRFVSDFDNSLSKQEDYFYLTSKLSYLLEKGSIYVAVNNLLNEEYSEYGVETSKGEKAFYPSPKINFTVGAEFRF